VHRCTVKFKQNPSQSKLWPGLEFKFLLLRRDALKQCGHWSIAVSCWSPARSKEVRKQGCKEKPEIQSTKSETIPNDQNPNVQNDGFGLKIYT
jgi:hypothetical protein